MHIILFAVTAVGTSKLEDVAKFFQSLLMFAKNCCYIFLRGWGGTEKSIILHSKVLKYDKIVYR